MIQFRLLTLSIAKGKDKLEKETRSKICVKIYGLEKHFRSLSFPDLSAFIRNGKCAHLSTSGQCKIPLTAGAACHEPKPETSE